MIGDDKMIVKKETPHLFIRLNNYENFNYIEEHKKCLEEKGYVWMLKIGKTINKNYINEVIKSGGGLIIKSSKKEGNQFYFCSILSIEPNDDKKLFYPKYYDELFYYEGYKLETLKEEAYWFKINSMIPIEHSIVDKFVVGKENKRLTDLAIETRVVHMYTKNKEEITL